VGVGDGLGVGDGDGVGDGPGVGDGDGVGAGVGDGVGVGDGEGVGDGVGAPEPVTVNVMWLEAWFPLLFQASTITLCVPADMAILAERVCDEPVW